jgi:hypothetical protein
MNFFIPSAEQAAIIHSSASLANITYKNAEQALHCIVLRVAENFKNKRSTALIIHDKQMQSSMLSMLQQVGLEDFCLFVSVFKTVAEDDLLAIRKHSEAQHKESLDLNAATFNFNVLKSNILQYYQAAGTQTIFKNKTWKSLLDEYLEKVKHEHSGLLHTALNGNILLDFTESEYDLLYQNVADALMLYQRDFELLELRDARQWLNLDRKMVDNPENLTYDLFLLREQAQSIAERYAETIKEIERLYIKSTHAHLDELVSRIHFLIHQCRQCTHDFKENKSYFSSWSGTAKENIKKEKALLNEINSFIKRLEEIKIIVPIGELGSISSAVTTLYDINQVLSDKKFAISDASHAYLKALNKLNYHDPILNDLEKDTVALLDKLNHTKIFKKHFELNTLSTKKQLEYLTKVIYEQEVMMMNLEKNIPYFQWLSFYEELDPKSQTLIKALRMFDPSDWLMLYDVWYLTCTLSAHYAFSDINEDSFETLSECHYALNNSAINQQRNDLFDVRKNLFSTLSKDFPALHKVLIKKKSMEHPQLWKYFLAENASFLSKMYAVVILDSDQVNEMPDGVFDELINFNIPDINLEIMQKFKNILSFYPMDEFNSTPDFILSEEPVNQHNTLKDGNITGRMALVRNIALQLLQFERKPAVFRLRGATIISFCSTYFNKQLNDYFYKKGIKQLFEDQSIKETITGALLDVDKSVYVLVEDWLINPDTEMEIMLHQRRVMQYLRDVGCIVLNYDTRASFENKGFTVNQLFDIIHTDQWTQHTDQNQLSFEFH